MIINRRRSTPLMRLFEMATNAVRSMGLSEFYEKQIAAAEKRGYQKAIEDMQAKLNKMFL